MVVVEHIKSMKEVTRSQYEALCDEVWHHNRLYFQESKPEISDDEYDRLVKRLEEMEALHPDWISETSPTQRIGEKPLSGFQDVTHEQPMLSLEKAFSADEIADFDKRMKKLLEVQQVTYCGELKMDGLAISVTYEQGRFVRAVTRGDGRVGSDVTANLKTLRSFPLRLAGANFPPTLELRGEVFLPKDAFTKMNEERAEKSLPLWANPRNAAAGSLKLLDPKEVAKRHDLSVIFYGVATHSKQIPRSQIGIHHFLQDLGLPTLLSYSKKFATIKTLHSQDEILQFAGIVNDERSKLPFAIDGVVVKVDNIDAYDNLGTTGKHPRGAIAYKFSAEQAWTHVHKITLQVGRTGVVTPVAELDTVPLAGSRISRATLHNFDELERKDIREGDFVCIEKGGDVIPKVVAVDRHKRSNKSLPFPIPTHCPACGSHLIKDPEEVAWRCPNSEGCKEQILRRLVHFASKHGLEIEHLGEKVMEQLVELGFVTKFSDIFKLNHEQVSQLEGFKDKAIKNLLTSIQKAKTTTLARLLMALGIRYVGTQMAEELAASCTSIDKLMQMDRESLLAIDGVGEKVATHVESYFQNKQNQHEIHELFKSGVQIASQEQDFDPNHTFFGKTLVLTGSLDSMPRNEAANRVRAKGGRIADTVSKKIDYLVVGHEPGSKLDKAKSLGITILDEQAFLRCLSS